MKQLSSEIVKNINEETAWKRNGGEQKECYYSGAFVFVVFAVISLIILIAVILHK